MDIAAIVIVSSMTNISSERRLPNCIFLLIVDYSNFQIKEPHRICQNLVIEIYLIMDEVDDRKKLVESQPDTKHGLISSDSISFSSVSIGNSIAPRSAMAVSSGAIAGNCLRHGTEKGLTTILLSL